MAGPIPLLNFDFGNPMDTALKAALGTYQGVTAGQANKTQNQMNKAKLPYVAQQEQALLDSRTLGNELTKYGIKQAEAEAPYYKDRAKLSYDKALTDYDKAKVELKMYPQSQQALINYQKAQAGLANAEAATKNYMLDNPGFMGGEDSKNVAGMLALLKQMEQQGLISPQQAQPASGQVIVETGAADQGVPDGPSYTREEILNSQQGGNQPESFYGVNATDFMEKPNTVTGTGIPADLLAPVNSQNKATNPYEEIYKQISNTFGRIGMQPWEIEAEKKRATENVTYFNKAMVPISEQAQKSTINNDRLRGMRETWERIPEADRGKALATLPAFPGAAQTFDALYNQMVLDAMALQKGTQGEKDASRIENSFASRKFTDDSMDETTTLLELTNQRAQEHYKFMAKKYKEKVSPSEAQTEWLNIVNKHSIFDSPEYLDYKIRSAERRKAREMGAR